MKSLLIIIVYFHTLLAFNYNLEPKKIAAATQCFFGLPEVMDEHNNGNMSNSCFVNMGNSYLVVDSGPTYQYAKQAFSRILEDKTLPMSYVVNTHLHDDHWLGNCYYKELHAKLIGAIAFKNLEKLDQTRMQKRISKEAYKKTTQVFPTIFVEDTKILDFDGKRVYIIAVNHKAHTNSDLLVYIPSKKLLFAGDLVFNERLPSLRDGDISGWIEALQKIKNMDVDYIVGGHGTLVSKKSVDFTYTYLSRLKKEVSDLLEEGEELGDVVNKVTMSEYKDIPFYNSIQRQNVAVTYRMLEWSSE